MSFAKNLSRNIGKNVSDKYTQKCLNHTKQPTTNPLKPTSKIAIQKTTVIWFAIKYQIKSQELHHRIVLKQSQMKQKILGLINIYVVRKKAAAYWWSRINIK